MKDEAQEARPSNIRDLLETLKKLAVHKDVYYFASLGESMPKWLQMALQ